MREKLKEVIFAEPDGLTKGLVLFIFSLPFFSIYLYFGVSFGSFITAVAFVIGGLAELLPKNYGHMAGVLRIAALVLLLGLLATPLVAPEIITPGLE